MANNLRASNNNYRPICAADDALQEILFASAIATDDLESLRLQLVAELSKLLYDLQAGRRTLMDATA